MFTSPKCILPVKISFASSAAEDLNESYISATNPLKDSIADEAPPAPISGAFP
jgi:hypothetical protein